jgi:hypothetical protein
MGRINRPEGIEVKTAFLSGGAMALALGAALIVSNTVVAQDSPSDLLPPSSSDPAPAPAPAAPANPAPASSSSSGEVVQPIPSGSGSESGSSSGSNSSSSSSSDSSSSSGPRLPSLAELEAMTGEELDELIGLEPRYDIPAADRRSLEEVGIISASEGGLPSGSLSRQPASLVRASLEGTQRPLISRWGHILLRRALVSRMDAPDGMKPAEFAALRADLLNRMGEHQMARALVQEVDTGNYNDALRDSAISSYIATSDLLGTCPIVRFADADAREDSDWQLLRHICASFAGEDSRASRDIRRLLSDEKVPVIDGRLAQRFAGAAGLGQRSVNIEWEGVGELTPFRFALANALGEAIPEGLIEGAGLYYTRIEATSPMVPAADRVGAAQIAAQSGILSGAAMVDLYSEAFGAGSEDGGEDDSDSEAARTGSRLRAAYVAAKATDRVAAMRDIWDGNDDQLYGRQVLTAYAAARIPAVEALAGNADDLIISMLSAGLERDAMAWSEFVEDGSLAWALLAVSQAGSTAQVDSDSFDDFVGDDTSSKQKKSRMLLASLVAMGRIATSDYTEYGEDLGIDLTRETRWTRAIDDASEAQNAALVALLAGLGMQGESWDNMTALHLYHIVRALERVGLEAEARMIAAEAVARA